VAKGLTEGDGEGNVRTCPSSAFIPISSSALTEDVGGEADKEVGEVKGGEASAGVTISRKSWLGRGLALEVRLMSRLMWLLVSGLLGRDKVVNIGRAFTSMLTEGGLVSGSSFRPLRSLVALSESCSGLAESEWEPTRNISSSL
jgi:hypothetical protein